MKKEGAFGSVGDGVRHYEGSKVSKFLLVLMVTDSQFHKDVYRIK
jgi:hypothetical protein